MNNANPRKETICAVFVTLDPDAGFPDRFARVADQAGFSVIVDNGSGPAARKRVEEAAERHAAEVILNEQNLGVAAALNQGIRSARSRSFPWVLTMDQDSLAEPFMVSALVEAHDRCPDRNKVAVIGSNYRDEKRGRSHVGEGAPGSHPYLDRDTVITSGSLMSLSAADRIGPFREEFFIDHVDDEYCLRALAKGYKVIMCRRPGIRHSIGSATGAAIGGKRIWSSNHSAARRYYMVRNFVLLAREYLVSRPRWVLSRLVRHVGFATLMVCLEDNRAEKLRSMGRGLVHGLQGRAGKIPFETRRAGR